MLKIFTFLSLCLLNCSIAFANLTQEETQIMQEQLENMMIEYRSAPDGVFDVEYDDEGFVSRLKIKSTMEVSTSLSGSRADRMASESAMRKARAAFSTFLTSEVVFVETSNEIISIIEKNKVETGEYVEVSSSAIVTASHSFQRGLITLMQSFDGEGNRRTCAVVLGWSKKLTNASLQVQESMNKHNSNTSTNIRIRNMDF